MTARKPRRTQRDLDREAFETFYRETYGDLYGHFNVSLEKDNDDDYIHKHAHRRWTFFEAGARIARERPEGAGKC